LAFSIETAMTRALRWAAIACLMPALVAAPAAEAQSPNAEPTAAATATSAARPAAPLGPDTPAGAVERFLAACHANDYEHAAEFLDLRKIPRQQRAKLGPQLARQLEGVLERKVELDPKLLSDSPEGELDDGLPPNRDLLAIVPAGDRTVELFLERVPTPDGLQWKLAAATVAEIPTLYEELGFGPFADRLPAPLVSIRLLGVRLWQWIGLVVFASLAASLSLLITTILTRVAHGVLLRAGIDHRFATHTVGPLRLLIGVAIMASGVPYLALPLVAERVVDGALKALVIIAFTWLLLRAIDVMATRAQRRFVQRRQLAAVSMIPLGRRVLKITVAVLAVMAALQNFGFNVTGLAAGLGIGGLAIALAAQKTVENLFGGVTLIADQPVRVGDFCRFGDTQGVVEDIGLRSTRIRTLDRTVVSVPNAQFSAMPLENLSRRDRIPVRATLALKPTTRASRVRDVLARLRALLAAQPKVEAETARASVVRLGAQIEIELFAYVLTTQWPEFLEHREQIFLAAMEVVGEDAAALK
jgi:MscS family membrane protein